MSIAEIVEKHGNDRENLLQILHDLQDCSGDHSLHHDAMVQLSRIMNLTVADIVGTASFYSMFSLRPRGRHVIRLCESPRATSRARKTYCSRLKKGLGCQSGAPRATGCSRLKPPVALAFAASRLP